MFFRKFLDQFDSRLNQSFKKLEGRLSNRYQYLGDNKGLTRLHTGDLFIVDTKSIDLAIPIINAGIWESWIEFPMMKFVKPGGTVLDCGANIGYYSVLLAKAVGHGGTLHSFEPSARTFGFLKNNLAINGLGNAHLHNLALNNKAPSSAFMWVDPEFSGGGYLSNDMETDMSTKGYQKLEIKTARLDDILSDDIIVDLMKVDVEGFEPDLLFGARRVIERSPGLVLIVELSPRSWAGQGHDPLSVFNYLENLGFSFKLANAKGELQPMFAKSLIEIEPTLGYTTCFFASRSF